MVHWERKPCAQSDRQSQRFPTWGDCCNWRSKKTINARRGDKGLMTVIVDLRSLELFPVVMVLIS